MQSVTESDALCLPITWDDSGHFNSLVLSPLLLKELKSWIQEMVLRRKLTGDKRGQCHLQSITIPRPLMAFWFLRMAQRRGSALQHRSRLAAARFPSPA